MDCGVNTRALFQRPPEAAFVLTFAVPTSPAACGTPHLCVTKKQKGILGSNKIHRREEPLSLRAQPFPSSRRPATWASSSEHSRAGTALLPAKDRTRLQPP